MKTRIGLLPEYRDDVDNERKTQLKRQENAIQEAQARAQQAQAVQLAAQAAALEQQNALKARELDLLQEQLAETRRTNNLRDNQLRIEAHRIGHRP